MPKDRSSKRRKSQQNRKAGDQTKASRRPTSGGAPSMSQDNVGWISKRTGVIIVLFVGLILGVYAGTQTVPALGWGEGLLWAAIIGGSIWIIGLGAYFLNRLFRSR